MPQAASLATLVREETGIEAELVRSSGGRFEIELDGELIYSKAETGEFPSEASIVDKIRDLS